MLDQLKEIVAEQLNVDADSITEETSFIDDLGADSLDIMEMVMQMEDTFNISIPTEDAGKLQTVGGCPGISEGEWGRVNQTQSRGFCAAGGSSREIRKTAEGAAKIPIFVPTGKRGFAAPPYQYRKGNGEQQ